MLYSIGVTLSRNHPSYSSDTPPAHHTTLPFSNPSYPRYQNFNIYTTPPPVTPLCPGSPFAPLPPGVRPAFLLIDLLRCE